MLWWVNLKFAWLPDIRNKIKSSIRLDIIFQTLLQLFWEVIHFLSRRRWEESWRSETISLYGQRSRTSFIKALLVCRFRRKKNDEGSGSQRFSWSSSIIYLWRKECNRVWALILACQDCSRFFPIKQICLSERIFIPS